MRYAFMAMATTKEAHACLNTDCTDRVMRFLALRVELFTALQLKYSFPLWKCGASHRKKSLRINIM